jgi:hypothetical protein
MTQLLDPSGPYICIWNDEVPCETQPLIVLRADGTPMTEAELLAAVFNGSEILPAPVPLPAGGLLLTTALAAAFIWRHFT